MIGPRPSQASIASFASRASMASGRRLAALVASGLLFSSISAHAADPPANDGGGGTVAAANSASAESAADISGMWWIQDYSPVLAPPDDASLPFTPAGRSSYEQNLVQLKSGAMADVGTTKCLPEGLPRSLDAAYPLQIIQHATQRGDYVTMIQELNHAFWSVAIGGAHPDAEDLDPAFMGDSIGHWSNKTLVIDSVGFKANSFLDDSGLPHDDQLHVVTHIRRLSHDQLEIVSTVEDPAFFSRPFDVRHTYEWRPDVTLLEYVCSEEHRVLSGQRSQGVLLKWVAK